MIQLCRPMNIMPTLTLRLFSCHAARCHGAAYKQKAKHYLNSGGKSSSLSAPQLLPTSELGLRIARRVIQAKCRRNGAILLERDFSDLHKKNRRGQASKGLPASKILNEEGNTGEMRLQ